MAEVFYNRGGARIAGGDTALDTSDLRMLLIVGASLPAGWSNKDLSTIADLDAVTGLDIHSQRVALASKTVTQNNTNDRAEAAASVVAFASAAGVTAWASVIYDEGGGADSTRHLIAGSSTGFGGSGLSIANGLEVTVNPWLLLQQGS